MAICDLCKQEMLTARSSVASMLRVIPKDGYKPKDYPRIRNGQEDGWAPVQCHDCRVAVGGYHHPAATSNTARAAPAKPSAARATSTSNSTT